MPESSDKISAIKVALENKGCTTYQAEGSPFDLIVSFYDSMDQFTILMVVSQNRKIKKQQHDFMKKWKGQVAVVDNAHEALTAVGKL